MCNDNEKPIYSSIEILQSELISNVVSVRSLLENDITSHLFLVVSDADYSNVTVERLAKHVVPVK